MKSKISALIVLACVAFGCKAFTKLTGRPKMTYVVAVRTEDEAKDSITDRVVQVLQRRFDGASVNAKVVRVGGQNDRIEINLYGKFDQQRTRSLFLTTSKLELKKVVDTFKTYPSIAAAEANIGPDQEVLPFVEDKKSSGPKFMVVEKKPVVTGADLRDASAFSRSGSADDNQINFSLNSDGAKLFGDWTGRNIGSYLAIVIDSKIISAPVIRGQIFDSGTIEGKFTKEAAEDLAISLRSGFLPAKLEILEEKPGE